MGVSLIFTGNKTITKSNRIDVSAWKVETPYTFWSEELDKDGMQLTVKSDAPVKHVFKGETSNNELYKKDNHIDCLLD